MKLYWFPWPCSAWLSEWPGTSQFAGQHPGPGSGQTQNMTGDENTDVGTRHNPTLELSRHRDESLVHFKTPTDTPYSS